MQLEHMAGAVCHCPGGSSTCSHCCASSALPEESLLKASDASTHLHTGAGPQSHSSLKTTSTEKSGDLIQCLLLQNATSRKIWRPHTRSPASKRHLLPGKLLSHGHGKSPLHPRLSRNKDYRVRTCFKTELISSSPWFLFQGKTSFRNDRFLSNISLMTNWHCHRGEHLAGNFGGASGTSICFY